MKKICYVLILILFCSFLGEVSAKECNKLTEENLKIFNAGSYTDRSKDLYCEAKTIQEAGCYPLTIASILASYGQDVDVYDVRDYLCETFPTLAEGRMYGAISSSQKFHDQFSMKMELIGTNPANTDDNLAKLNTSLSEGKAVMISIQGGAYDSDSSGHYIAIPFKKDNEYYLLNTGKRDTVGYISESTLRDQILDHINAGMYSIIPTTCDSTSSSQENTGLLEDPHPNIYGDTNVQGEHKGTLFFDVDGNPTQLKGFLDDLFLLIRILTPVLVIILSTLDYIRAVASSNADDLKKANQRTIKRVFIGLIVFFLPFLLDLIFHLFGLYDISTGGIGG